MLGQCRKKDVKYRTVAIESSGKAAKALKVDCFSELFSVCQVILTPTKEEEEKERGVGEEGRDREEAREERVAMTELQIKAVEALGDAWPGSDQSQGTNQHMLSIKDGVP